MEPVGEHEHEVADHSDEWRAVLMGESRGLERTKRLVGWIPAGPRCKLCFAPLKPPGSVVLKLVAVLFGGRSAEEARLRLGPAASEV